jgi:hypothetical protein
MKDDSTINKMYFVTSRPLLKCANDRLTLNINGHAPNIFFGDYDRDKDVPVEQIDLLFIRIHSSYKNVTRYWPFNKGLLHAIICYYFEEHFYSGIKALWS